MKPLFLQDKVILVTRPKQQSEHLIQLITQHGGTAVAFPVLEITALQNNILSAQFKNLKLYQWLIFISVNAVNFAVAANNGKIEAFTQAKIAAVGKATAKALEDNGLNVDLVPQTGFNSEALLAMPELQNVSGGRFLIIRGVGGRETLAQELKNRGAVVDYCEVYRRIMPTADNSEVVSLLTQQRLSWLTATSTDALQNLISMLELHKTLLFSIPLVVISERIKHKAISLGFKNVLVSKSPDDEAILNTMIMITNGEGQ
jgi:uroporphyrinogen-III synthase